MKIPCSIIRDLLPLYSEGIASEETKTFVDEHLSGCDSCQKELEQIGSKVVVATDNDIAPLKKIKSSLRQKKVTAVGFAVTLTLLFVMLCLALLYSPRPIPYTADNFSVTVNKDNVISVTTNWPVAGWNVFSTYSELTDGEDYSITAWTNYLTEWTNTDRNYKKIVVVESEKKVSKVYYNPSNGMEGILIYGKKLPIEYGFIQLANLGLAKYLSVASIAVTLIAIAIAITYKNRLLRYLLLRLGYLPFSYIISHILVKGIALQTFAMVYDFYAILIIAIPVYILCLLVERLFRKESLPWGGG